MPPYGMMEKWNNGQKIDIASAKENNSCRYLNNLMVGKFSFENLQCSLIIFRKVKRRKNNTAVCHIKIDINTFYLRAIFHDFVGFLNLHNLFRAPLCICSIF